MGFSLVYIDNSFIYCPYVLCYQIAGHTYLSSSNRSFSVRCSSINFRNSALTLLYSRLIDLSTNFHSLSGNLIDLSLVGSVLGLPRPISLEVTVTLFVTQLLFTFSNMISPLLIINTYLMNKTIFDNCHQFYMLQVFPAQLVLTLSGNGSLAKTKYLLVYNIQSSTIVSCTNTIVWYTIRYPITIGGYPFFYN